MENQVLTIEQMQELIAMGVDTSKASMIWEYKGSNETKNFYNLDILDYDNDFITKEDIPTFTFQDCLELLPSVINIDKDIYGDDSALLEMDKQCGRFSLMYRYWAEENSLPEELIAFNNKSYIIAAFKMLKWCKENGYI